MVKLLITSFFFLMLSQHAQAEDEIELKITTIKGNKELPKILYLVPWKDIKRNKKAERKLVLHSLFGDLFDPVLPGKTVVSANKATVK
jgi:hypothetical protein